MILLLIDHARTATLPLPINVSLDSRQWPNQIPSCHLDCKDLHLPSSWSICRSHTFSPNGTTPSLHSFPRCRSSAVRLSFPTLNLDMAMAAHRAIHCMIGELISSSHLSFVSSWSLYTLSVSRTVRPASSTTPLQACSPLCGCSGLIIPPWVLAKDSLTATMAGSPSYFKVILPFSPPG